MTDVPYNEIAVPARFPVTARLIDGRLVLDLNPTPETQRDGIIRASVLAYVLDAVTGISVDEGSKDWTLTTDLSIRMRPVPAPELVSADARIVRRGRRSVTLTCELTAPDGSVIALGAAGFATIPRQPDDPEKPNVPPEEAVRLFGRRRRLLSKPLRDEAGVEVLDARNGVHQLDVTPEVRNPNGTLQGGMVALLAESAVEDLLEARYGEPVIVTDLDIRYLARAEVGPVRSSCRVVGDGPEAAVEVTLTDTKADRVTTLVYARAARSSL